MQLEMEYSDPPAEKRRRDPIWMVFILLLLGFEVFWLFQWVSQDEGPSVDIESYIYQAGQQYDVAPELIKAIVWQESRFNPDARGKAGEIGLMQLMSGSASEWAAASGISPFEHEIVSHPLTNTLAGTWYLKKMLNRYQNTDNPLPYALADYNAGRSNVLRWNKNEAETNSAAFFENIDYPGTKKYIHNVIERFAYYKTNEVAVTAK